MLPKTIITLTLIFISCKPLTAYKYSLLLRDENIVSPCNRSDAYFVDRYLEMSDIHFEFLETGGVLDVQGTIVWKMEPITDIIGKDDVSIQVFKKKRGTWVNTIYSVQRLDVCTAVFNPSELWHKYIANVPIEERKCPFFKGQKFYFNTSTHFEINLPDPNAAGEYRGTVNANLHSLNEKFCCDIFGELFRVQ